MQQTGVEICAVDFSNPQSGKEACDRKAATLKSHIRIYSNEGYNVEDGNQMKKALESKYS